MADIVVGANRTTLDTIADAWDTAQGGSVGRRPTGGGGLGQAKEGNSTHSGTGAATTFTVTHAAGFQPSRVELDPNTAAAAAAHWVTIPNATTFVINFAAAPASGTDNIKFTWVAYK